MKCPACDGSLDFLKGNLKIRHCPYCGGALDTEILLSTAREKLAYLVKQKGKSIFSSSNRNELMASLEKWPSALSKERDVFQLLAIKKIPDAIVNACDLSMEGASGIVQECLSTLTEDFGIHSARAVEMLHLVADAVNLDISEMINGKPSVPKEDPKKKKSSPKLTGGYDEDNQTFTDDRDGRVYRTVKIGNQIWLAENFKYEIDDSFAYGDDASRIEEYGRLYTWPSAKRVAPKGWHLPSNKEWDVLENFVKWNASQNVERSLRSSTRHWNSRGVDQFGFCALPAGCRKEGGCYSDMNKAAYFWTAPNKKSGGTARLSDRSSICQASLRKLDCNDFREELGSTLFMACSVRLIKD